MKSSVVFLSFAFLVNGIYKAEGKPYENFEEVVRDKAMEQNCEFKDETLEDGQEGYKVTIKKKELKIKMPTTLQTRKDLFEISGLEDICRKREINELPDYDGKAAVDSFLRTCVKENIYESRVDMRMDYSMSKGVLTVHIENPHYLLPKHEQFDRRHRKLLFTVLAACDTFPWAANEIHKLDNEETSKIKSKMSKERREHFNKLLESFEEKIHGS